MPQDAMVHQFRGLVLFALGKYDDAAATLHPVLAITPGWDWTTMSSLYPETDVYSKQLRALETFVNEHPKDSAARFVLAYHYLVCGHKDQASEQLARIQQAVPNDGVTAQLLTMLGKSATPPAAPVVAESNAKIDVSQLLGTWTSSRDGKAQFELTLEKDKDFTWTYQEGKVKQKLSGAYAVDGSVLALEPDAGGVMVAEVSEPRNGTFTFRTVGAPPSDKGLTFRKK
jgi:tetratricopeptide (TPR) repeat protein